MTSSETSRCVKYDIAQGEETGDSESLELIIEKYAHSFMIKISFDGEILMQGRKVSGRTPEADDDVPIVLLKEEPV